MGRLRTIAPRLKAPASRIVQHSPREAASKPGGKWLYGRPWRKARKEHLAEYPLCVHCERAGKVKVATDVDHRIPHKGSEVLFWDRLNWQSLCGPCHARKTAAEDGGYGNPSA